MGLVAGVEQEAADTEAVMEAELELWLGDRGVETVDKVETGRARVEREEEAEMDRGPYPVGRKGKRGEGTAWREGLSELRRAARAREMVVVWAPFLVDMEGTRAAAWGLRPAETAVRWVEAMGPIRGDKEAMQELRGKREGKGGAPVLSQEGRAVMSVEAQVLRPVDTEAA